MPNVSQKQVEEWLQEYQVILRMRDWKISVRLVSKPELPEGDSGFSYFNEESQSALLLILSQESYDRDYSSDERFLHYHDIEQTLVHELLHPKFHIVENHQNPAFEFAVDSVAEAIVKLRRCQKV